jgi:hypothetical protein
MGVCVGTLSRVMWLEVKAWFTKFHEKVIECQISAQILLTATVICVAYLYHIINSVFSCHCCPLAAQSFVLSSSDDPRFGYITNTYLPWLSYDFFDNFFEVSSIHHSNFKSRPSLLNSILNKFHNKTCPTFFCPRLYFFAVDYT